MELEPLEKAVLAKLLEGDHPTLWALRQQLEGISVWSRELSGAGFFTELAIASSAAWVEMPDEASPLGGVSAEIPGLEAGAGFLLWVDQGRLSMLEGYSYEEPWPERVDSFTLEYDEPERRELLARLG